jgi:hypothetical protein
VTVTPRRLRVPVAFFLVAFFAARLAAMTEPPWIAENQLQSSVAVVQEFRTRVPESALQVLDIAGRDAGVKRLPAIGYAVRPTRDRVGKEHAFIDVFFQGRDDLGTDVDALLFAVVVAGKERAAEQ